MTAATPVAHTARDHRKDRKPTSATDATATDAASLTSTMLPPRTRRVSRAKGRVSARFAAGAIDWELLQWLLRCPFLRMEDLATFCGVSLATMCRRLETTEAQGLVEHVRAAGLTRQGIERVYHLSNQGLHLLAAALDTGATMLGRRCGTDELRLLQHLPRIAQLVRVQTFISGVLAGAQVALGEQGRRVRGTWHWVRNYVHPFASPRPGQRRTLLQVDAALALHVTAQRIGNTGPTGTASTMERLGGAATSRSGQSDTDGWDSRADWERQDRWYAAFVLADAQVQDWTAARRTLDTLLSYHECSERWAIYQSFPPVLVLASSARHLERWLTLAREVAESRQLPALAGAVTLVPGPPDAHGELDPWRLAWRLLRTGQTISLRSLLLPLPRAAVPPGADGRGAPAFRADLAPQRTITVPRQAPRVIAGHFDERAQALVNRAAYPPDWRHAQVSLPAPSPVVSASTAGGRIQQVAPPTASSPTTDGTRPPREAAGAVEVCEGPVGRTGQVEPAGETTRTGGSGGTSARDGGQRAELRLLTARLGGRLVEVLNLLFRAPWIEMADLADLLGIPLSSADRYLSALARHSLLIRDRERDFPTMSRHAAEPDARGVQGTHLCFTPRCRLRLSSRGQHLVAAMHHIGLRSRLAQRAAPSEPIALDHVTVSAAITNGKRDHAAGIYHFFACLARAAAQEAMQRGEWHAAPAHEQRQVSGSRAPVAPRLVWWETTPLCEDRYRYQGHWHNLRPDGAGVYQASSRRLRFWLEWDCGSMNGVDLTRKFTAYATYVLSGRWREVTADHVLPVLLIVVQGRGQMDRMRRVARQVFASFPALAAPPTHSNGERTGSPVGVHIPAFITLAHRLEEAGPLAAIWWPLLPSASSTIHPSSVLAETALKSGGEPGQLPPVLSARWEQPRCVFPSLHDEPPAPPVDMRHTRVDEEDRRSGRTGRSGAHSESIQRAGEGNHE